MEKQRRRYNLYYIFAQDRKAHPMPGSWAEKLRRMLLQRFFEKRKTQ